MSEMQYKTEEYVVAFIDVLGSSEKIRKDADASLNAVHKAYSDALEMLNTISSHEGFVIPPEVKIFSDNIVIFLPTEPYGRKDAFISVAIFAAMTQIAFVKNGDLVRGGIAMSDFFSDSLMIWGNALVDAHELESSVAVYPRIVIHPYVVATLRLLEQLLELNWLKEDVDGLLYIDYLKPAMGMENNEFLNLFGECIDHCRRLINSAGAKVRVQQKLAWHRSYLEMVCKEIKIPYDGGAENA